MIAESGQPGSRGLSPLLRYAAGVLLAVAAQLARLPLPSPTSIPYITHVPFILLSAALGGLGPGLLATGLCTLESLYFATEPIGAFAAGHPAHWLGLGTLALTGVVTSVLFERLNRARREAVAVAETRTQLAREVETRQRMLEAMIQNSTAAMALLRGPDFRFETINPAYQALAPGEPMTGRTVAEVWPEAAPIVVPLLEAVRHTATAYHATALAVPLHRGPGSAVEERHFDFSYVPLVGFGAAGDPGVLVAAIEVTKYKRSEESLLAAYSELAAIYANAPMVLLVVDGELRVEKVNDLAARFAGREMASMLGLPAGGAIGCLNALADPKGCGHGASCRQCPTRVAVLDTLGSGASHASIEAWLPLSVGGLERRRCLLVSTAAIQFDHTKKVLVCAQDITELKVAQRELQQQHQVLERQSQLIGLSHDAIIIAGSNRVVRGWNKGAEEIYGWTEAEAVGSMMGRLLETSPASSIATIDDHLSREGRWEGELTRTRRDGQQIVLECRRVLLHDTNGTADILEIGRDITDRRRAEDALQASVRELKVALAEKTVLLQEVHHRVKNNLAVISSLLDLKADTAEIPEVKLALGESRQRVHSMALIHEHLYGNDHLDRIDFSEYARELVQGMYSLSGEAGRISIGMDLDPIELGIDRAVPCALILNELLSNAFKYAFPDQRNGKIRVAFRESEPGSLELVVEDNGVGLPAGRLGKPDTKSLGLRIVGILTKQLDGSIQQEACAGTRILLRFPA
ncbi:MAG: PAS domain-containing protein [Acidobacteriia bacterium]|nr:PAS domain-containing protein [Terriglobia bacterium]